MVLEPSPVGEDPLASLRKNISVVLHVRPVHAVLTADGSVVGDVARGTGHDVVVARARSADVADLSREIADGPIVNEVGVTQADRTVVLIIVGISRRNVARVRKGVRVERPVVDHRAVCAARRSGEVDQSQGGRTVEAVGEEIGGGADRQLVLGAVGRVTPMRIERLSAGGAEQIGAVERRRPVGPDRNDPVRVRGTKGEIRGDGLRRQADDACGEQPQPEEQQGNRRAALQTSGQERRKKG